MKLNSFAFKVILILALLAVTFFYAQNEKTKYYSNESKEKDELVLKFLPEFKVADALTGNNINSIEYIKGSKGLFVHIWGTWCAPCEKEMPDFLTYAQSVEARGVKFLLVAVNDEEMKVKKYIARFKIPANVQIVIDKENKVMELFGTLKVPETFLFSSAGKHVNKFVGPQEWREESYQTRLEYWLNPQKLMDRKIETH